MKENILVVDIGTQSLRASVIRQDGETLAFSQLKYNEPYFSPEAGFAEQDPNYYLLQLATATKELEAKQPGILATILGLVIDAFRDTAVILDKDKKPVRPSILWLDQRVTRLHQKNLKIYERALFFATGMTDTVKYNAERTPSFWLMKHEPENWKKMAYYVPLTAYFNYRITGNLLVSSADCIGHYPINFKKGTWLSKIHPKIDVLGIPYKALCPLLKVGKTLGTVTAEFSAFSGIPEGTPLFASGSDKACETFGNGAIDTRCASISLGTACTIDVVAPRYSEPETFLPSYQAPYAGAYDLELQIYRGLWMIKWFSDQFGEIDAIKAQEQKMSVEDYLNEKILSIAPGCEGLVLQPYWGPSLKRPNARGSILGFTAIHTRFHVYRAIIEGIAFALREGLDEIMRKTHKVPDYLVVSGGGSTSDVFCHIIADVFGIPVRRSKTSEATTLGGAMSGYLAAGIYKTPSEARDAMTALTDTIVPDSQTTELYDRLYHTVYLKMYPSLKRVYDASKDFYLESIGEN